MLWCQKGRSNEVIHWEERGTRCPVMPQSLMLSVIFLVKDNAAEEFNGAVRVITGRRREKFVCAHQKKLQVICSANKKESEWSVLSSHPHPLFSLVYTRSNLQEWSRVKAQVCLTRSCFLPILHLRESSLILKEKTLNPEIAMLRFEQHSAEAVVFTGRGEQQLTSPWLYLVNTKVNEIPLVLHIFFNCFLLH